MKQTFRLLSLACFVALAAGCATPGADNPASALYINASDGARVWVRIDGDGNASAVSSNTATQTAEATADTKVDAGGLVP